MPKSKYQTMGQQHGRRSWAEPWKIKMVEPIHMLSAARKAVFHEPPEGATSSPCCAFPICPRIAPQAWPAKLFSQGV